MKNAPRVPRPARSQSAYTRKRKRAYPYPEWVTAGRQAPAAIRAELDIAREQAYFLVAHMEALHIQQRMEV
jgi:hypothetical protein